MSAIRETCAKMGRCYLEHRKPHIEIFDDDLPGRTEFTDIDAAHEYRGHFLFVEFKGYRGALPTGQRIFAEQLTAISPKITFIHAHHNVILRETYGFQIIRRGKVGPWIDGDTARLKAVVRSYGFDAERFERWLDEKLHPAPPKRKEETWPKQLRT